MPPIQCFVVLLYFLSSVDPTVEPCPLRICMLCCPSFVYSSPCNFAGLWDQVIADAHVLPGSLLCPCSHRTLKKWLTYSRVTHIPLARFSLQGLHLPENGLHWMSPLIPPCSPAGHSFLVALCPKLLSFTASHCPFLLELNTSHYRSSKMRCLIEMYVLFIFIIVVLKDIKRKTWKFCQIFHLKPVFFKCPHATCNLYEMFLTVLNMKSSELGVNLIFTAISIWIVYIPSLE